MSVIARSLLPLEIPVHPAPDRTKPSRIAFLLNSLAAAASEGGSFSIFSHSRQDPDHFASTRYQYFLCFADKKAKREIKGLLRKAFEDSRNIKIKDDAKHGEPNQLRLTFSVSQAERHLENQVIQSLEEAHKEQTGTAAPLRLVEAAAPV